MRSRNTRFVWVCLLIGTTFGAVGATPGTAYSQSDRSLLKSDLVRMMTGDSYTAEEVLHIVRMNCVGFAPSDRDRKDLARLFDGDDLLDEIDRCREKGQSAGYRRGLPVARKVVRVDTPAPQPIDPDVEAPALISGAIDRPALHEPPVGAKAPVDTMPGVLPSVPPKLLNWEYVTRQILTEYRPDERHSGSVVLKIWVNEQGQAGDPSILDSSGDPALAKVVLAVVPLMRFTPAESRNRRVGAWATLPIHFETD